MLIRLDYRYFHSDRVSIAFLPDTVALCLAKIGGMKQESHRKTAKLQHSVSELRTKIVGIEWDVNTAYNRKLKKLPVLLFLVAVIVTSNFV